MAAHIPFDIKQETETFNLYKRFFNAPGRFTSYSQVKTGYATPSGYGGTTVSFGEQSFEYRRQQLLQETERWRAQGQRYLVAFVNDEIRQVTYDGLYTIADVTSRSLLAGLSAIEQQMVEYLNDVRVRSNRRDSFLRIHKDLAAGSVRATIRAWNAAPKGAGREYREDSSQPRLVGQMLRALQHPDFVRAGVDGVAFGNEALLDRVAAHWHRLNYGVAPANTPGPRGVRTQFFGQVRQVNLKNDSPSPRMFIPPGLFIKRDGGVQFYPASIAFVARRAIKQGQAQELAELTEPRFSKHGFKGKRFLDAGYRYLAIGAPKSYEKLVRGWFAGGTERTRAVKVNYARPGFKA